ncbi:hypothetical protein [Reichenbachiella versicolor]|uniref:hypothetical protein n=1 Tax=Reichenbachiella versicolor TaxID=1821036 RepID=UPI000D6E7822|nr:hypothetical protein [Reichenbachiella versicolor]
MKVSDFKIQIALYTIVIMVVGALVLSTKVNNTAYETSKAQSIEHSSQIETINQDPVFAEGYQLLSHQVWYIAFTTAVMLLITAIVVAQRRGYLVRAVGVSD